MKRVLATTLAMGLWAQPLVAFSAQSAKVLMVRGEVTKLLPGKTKASSVKRGETLPEDTSVLTSDKSIVRLKFKDNSTMNLGPKSKVVITKMPEKKPNMINLLTGAIKAEVDKKDNKENRNKMIIKTRSAVMGIRGTKFQATYNPINRNTGLVTVEGRVAMMKKEDVVASNAPVIDSSKELDLIDNSIKNDDKVVEVEAGKFSGVQETASAPTTPVKIAPKQYEAIAKSMGSDEKAEEVMKTEDARAEVENLADGPRPGGFVDFDTGIYVPPPKEAKLDENTATFTAKDMGEVDQDTGDYIPPKGVTLDAKKGFVVDQEEVAKLASSGDRESVQKAIANVQSVNEEVKTQVKKSPVVANKVAATTKKERSWWSPKSHVLGLELTPYSESLVLEASGEGDSEFYSKSASDTLLVWSQVWNDYFSTDFKIGGVQYEFEDENKFENGPGTDDDGIVSIQGNYRFAEKWTAQAALTNRPFYFVIPGDGDDTSGSQTNPYVVSANLSFITLGALYDVMNWEKFALKATGQLLVFGEDQVNTRDGDETLDSFGLKAGLNGIYAFSDSLGLSAEVFWRRISHVVTSAEDDPEFVRNSLGTTLNLNWNL